MRRIALTLVPLLLLACDRIPVAPDLWDYHGLLTRPDGSQAVFSFQMHWRQWAPTKVTASLK